MASVLRAILSSARIGIIVTILILVLAGATRHLSAIVQARTFFSGTMTLVGGVPPAIDSDLLLPARLAVVDTSLFVFDYGDYAVKAFSRDGHLLWTSGHYGAGPGDFRGPRDLKTDSDGNIWILDPGNARVTILSRSGRIVDTKPTGAYPLPVNQLLPLRGGEFWATSLVDPAAFAVRFDTEGNPIELQPLPGRAAELSPMLRGTVLAGTTDGRAAFAFDRVDGWGLWNLAEHRMMIHAGVESIPPPEIVQRDVPNVGVYVSIDSSSQVTAALDVTVAHDTVYVLFDGRTDLAGRIVDAYVLSSGSYVGSYMLPERAVSLEVNEGEFTAIIRRPIPAIRIWRWQETEMNPGGSERALSEK